MRTALYIRVSTEDQAREGYSISAQKEKLTAYCASQGWTIANMYIDDGYSAKDLDRPEMKRMIRHIKQGLIDCVLVYRLDRLTRSVSDLYKLLELFEKYNCKFKSATEVYDTTTAMGRMFITVVAALAQWERENLAERVRMGLQEKARQGKWVPNIAPYGYDIDRETDKLVINEKEAAVVRKIFELYTSGKGMSKIANELNRLGILTKSGHIWRDHQVKYVLTNPVYIGTMRYNFRVNKDSYFEIENAVPAIISKEVFDRAQQILNRRKFSHPRAATSSFIFSTIAKCARCGSSLSGKWGTTKRGDKRYQTKTYYCPKRKFGVCDMPYIAERFMEQQLLAYLEKIDVDSDILDELPQEQQDETDRIEWLQTELKAVEKRRTKWQYAWANDMISDEDFALRMKEEAEKEEALRKELENIRSVAKTINANELKEIIQNIRLNWDHLEPTEKKILLQTFIKEISFDKVGERRADCVKIVNIQFYE